ncbi:MAG TPA: hypothetical protein QF509_04125 [Rhodospirillales bacterium]|jgi:hypothetical protein|nr:hypothetical protein [Rhodospirillales bacterium]
MVARVNTVASLDIEALDADVQVQRARHRFLNYLVLTFAGTILAIPVHTENITGKARVIDATPLK